MNDDIEIRPSTISGRGVFARRQFRKGETVLRWDVSRKIRRDRIDSLSSEEHHFLNPFDDTFFVLLGEPERYVNHSCANNTRVEQFTDVAVRDILPGEEITSDYRSGGRLSTLYVVAALQTAATPEYGGAHSLKGVRNSVAKRIDVVVGAAGFRHG